MKDQENIRLAETSPPPEASLAAAFYPGKEAWKNEPGNRYTPGELREMDQNWDIKIVNPYTPECRSAD